MGWRLRRPQDQQARGGRGLKSPWAELPWHAGGLLMKGFLHDGRVPAPWQAGQTGVVALRRQERGTCTRFRFPFRTVQAPVDPAEVECKRLQIWRATVFSSCRSV